MITVMIKEQGGQRRSWTHHARTTDVETAVTRAVSKHFSKGSYFQADDIDQAIQAYAALAEHPIIKGQVWRPAWSRGMRVSVPALRVSIRVV